MIHSHASDAELERLCLGTIDSDELGRLTDHLLNCAECETRFGQSRDYIRAMQRALVTLTPDWPDPEEEN